MSGRFRFLTSATKLSECPADLFPEVAVLGRSNAGKSTLINAWTGSQVAKTSSKPGKTRLINFFEGPTYRLVDFPGYGYSSRSGDEQASWAAMIEPFLGTRGGLKAALLVVDSRREWTDDEDMLVRFLKRRSTPVGVVLTKADKLTRAEEAQVIKRFAQIPNVDQVFLISSTKKTGIEDLEDFVFQKWVKA